MARVHIGQIIMSIPTKLQNKQRVTDALHSQFSCSVMSLCYPMDCSMPGFPVRHQLPELAQTHVHRVSDAIQPSRPVVPFSSCLQSFPASGSFPESVLCIRYWSFSFSISPSNEYSGLISFRIDWFDLHKPRSNSLTARRPESLSEDLVNSMGMNLKTWQKSGSSQRLWGQIHPQSWPPGRMGALHS